MPYAAFWFDIIPTQSCIRGIHTFVSNHLIVDTDRKQLVKRFSVFATHHGIIKKKPHDRL